jgi:(p)ppGpp synthase/HD superfamily hydrolase
MNIIEAALDIAVSAHAGQVRKSNKEPYIMHVLRVYGYLSGESEVAKAAGLLHDVVEDSYYTVAILEVEGFPPQVLKVVKDLTEDKGLPWTERKQHTIDSIPMMGTDSLLVLMADKVDNMRSSLEQLKGMENPAEFWGMFKAPKEEQLWYYTEIANELSKTEVQHGRLFKWYETYLDKLTQQKEFTVLMNS